MIAGTVSLEEVSHLALLIGRLLFQNSADTEEVANGVRRFANFYGCEVHLLVTYETLLLTLSRDHECCTKAGNRVPGMNVNMAAIAAIEKLLSDVEAGRVGLEDVRAQLDQIEHQRPVYSRWIVVVGLGLTAAGLSRLFGGDWPTFLVTFVAGAVGTWLRQELGRRGANLFLIAFSAALLSGVIGGVGVLLHLSAMPSLCFLAPGMIIVPGVPLVNCILDMIRNHMAMGISRLGFGLLLTLAIAGGLFTATAVTGVSIPVEEPSHLPPLMEDAVFSALAALGYLFLFNVPLRLAWVGILCGVASHTTRTFLLQHGVDIVSGSLIGALAAGFLAHAFARSFQAPVSAFAFPGVVAMIPGSYAFRAVIGYIGILHNGSAAAAPLIAETLALSVTCLLMVLAIAIGVAAPIILFKSPRTAH